VRSNSESRPYIKCSAPDFGPKTFRLILLFLEKKYSYSKKTGKKNKNKNIVVVFLKKLIENIFET
jgi:hypothetical protein